MENKPFTHPIGRLPHESLHAYEVAREILAFVASRRGRFRGLPGELASHIERSSVSTLMNVAEAAGRIATEEAASPSPKGEACELAAALEAAHLFGTLGAEEHAHARGLLVRLTKRLARLAA